MKKLFITSIIFGVLTAILLMLFLSNGNDEMTELEDDGYLDEDELIEEDMNLQLLEISEGHRAISITVDEVQGVSGFLRAGDYVDVISHHLLEDGIPMTQILLQNIKILSVGSAHTIGEEFTSYRTVTLEVTPMEGATLSLASENGIVAFMLRGVDDHERAPSNQVTIEQLQKGE